MKDGYTKTLETSRLILRKITLDDADGMFNNWACDKEVTKYLNWNAHENINETKEIIISWMERYSLPHYYQWVIELKEPKQVIGTISLFKVDTLKESCEIGYCLSKKYWNQGLMTEACHKVLDFAFNIIGFKQVTSRHIKENTASGKVMLKNNMKYISTTTEYSHAKKELINVCNYVINKEDFK